MAENLDMPSFGNFSIENTMEMGAGSAELLNDLMSPETSTGNPDDIQKIVKDAEPPAPDPKPDVPKGKEIVPKEDGKEPTGQDLISSFLGDNSSEEEDSEEADPEPVKKKAPAAEETSTDDEGVTVVDSGSLSEEGTGMNTGFTSIVTSFGSTDTPSGTGI